MDKSVHAVYLSQALQTKNKQYKNAVNILPEIVEYLMLQLKILSFFTTSVNDENFKKLPFHLLFMKSRPLF